MRQQKEIRHYGEHIEQRTVTGWVCKICNRFWGDDQHMASYCCATHRPCSRCQKPVEKHWTKCGGCRELSKWEQYEKLPELQWDGKVAIHDDVSNEYYFDLDELCEELACETESIQQMRLHPCVTTKPRHIELGSDYFDELATEDGEIQWKSDPRAIEKQLNDWIDENAPTVWHPDMKHRLTFDDATLAEINKAMREAQREEE